MITIHSAPSNEQEYDKFLEELTNVYSHKKQFSMLIDTSALQTNLLDFVAKMGKWIKTNKENSILYLKKTAILLQSPVMQFFLNAVFFVVKPSTPYKITRNLEEAIEFLEWRQHHQVVKA